MRKWFEKLNPNKKPAIVVILSGYLLFVLFVIWNILKSIITGSKLSCPTAGGPLSCDIIGFLLMGIAYLLWYTILIILPIAFVAWIITLLIKKFKDKK